MRATRRSGWRSLARALILTLAAALCGCAGRHGAIRWDGQAGRDFDAAQVLPGHRYYTTGSDTRPDAILALRGDRPLRSDRWREVAMTPEALRKLTGNMRGTRDVDPDGAVVLDDHGVRIGVWYSYLRPTPVEILDDGGVFIAPPVDPLSGPFDRRRGGGD